MFVSTRLLKVANSRSLEVNFMVTFTLIFQKLDENLMKYTYKDIEP